MAKFWEHLEKHPDMVEKHRITEQEIIFLKRLQTEMNTQDTVGQADPRYWVIRDYERLYGDGADDADGVLVYEGGDGSAIAEIGHSMPVGEASDRLLDGLREAGYEIDEEAAAYIKEAHDMGSLVERVQGAVGYDLRISGYREIPVDKGMFLTQEAAARHLKSNEYHYAANAHTYAKTAWRSPEEGLWKILQSVDMDQLGTEERTEGAFVMELLEKEALYAQRSHSRPLLQECYGKAEMALLLGAITQQEFMQINHMTVYYMNTHPNELVYE